MEYDYTVVETAWGDKEVMIDIKRDSNEFKAASKVLSDFMETLNLPADQHNKLVDLMLAVVDDAEQSAYTQGVGLGLDYARFEAEENGEKRKGV